jgi:hypothetical protein
LRSKGTAIPNTKPTITNNAANPALVDIAARVNLPNPRLSQDSLLKTEIRALSALRTRDGSLNVDGDLRRVATPLIFYTENAEGPEIAMPERTKLLDASPVPIPSSSIFPSSDILASLTRTLLPLSNITPGADSVSRTTHDSVRRDVGFGIRHEARVRRGVILCTLALSVAAFVAAAL